MRTIVAGSRGIEDYELVNRVLSECPWQITMVVSGTAHGVDRLGEQWAIKNNIPMRKFPADFARYGKASGVIRNRQMAEFAQALVAVWDGVSPGTKNMIQEARKRGLKVFIYNTEGFE